MAKKLFRIGLKKVISLEGFFFEGSAENLQKLNEIISHVLFLLSSEKTKKSKTPS